MIDKITSYLSGGICFIIPTDETGATGDEYFHKILFSCSFLLKEKNQKFPAKKQPGQARLQKKS